MIGPTDAPLRLRTLRLPGAAGALQAADARRELIAELGGAYARYHRFLAERLEALGTEADPHAFVDDFDGYATACAAIEDVYRAESWLRHARAIVEGPVPGPPMPFVDTRGRLVSVLAGTAVGTVGRGRSLRPAVPPPIGA